MSLTFGSLFAGIGGFDLGFERAGMVCKWQVEIDEYCRRVLAKHWPHVRRWDDVRTFPPEPADKWKVDVVCGGFPCQDISYAGRGAGIKGERSGLFFEFVRIIGEMEPRIVVVENVAALLGRGIDDVLGTLASLGYDAEWDCLPAAFFNAPHIRERYFILAYSQREQWPLPFLQADNDPFTTNRTAAKWCSHGVRFEMGTAGCRLRGSRWLDQPKPFGVVDGVPKRLDAPLRLKGLGNAVVPQVAEWIGRRIVEVIDD